MIRCHWKQRLSPSLPLSDYLSVYTTFFLFLFLPHTISHHLLLFLSLFLLPSRSLSLYVYRSAWRKARSLNISSSSSRAKPSYTKAVVPVHSTTRKRPTGKATVWLFLSLLLVLHCTVLYCTVLYCAVLCCTLMCCTVLYYTVLYCTYHWPH